MKVVQINSECGRGSTGKIAVSISDMLTQRGIENYIFYSGNHTSDYPKGVQINSKFDLRVHQLLSRIFGDQGWHSYAATKRLIRRLEELNPDCVHLHNIHGYYLNIPVLFKYLKKSNCKVIWTFHDCWPITGHCAYFTTAKCDKWKTECGNCPNKRSYPYSLFFDRSTSLYRKKKNIFTSLKNLTIVTPSKWLAEIVEQSFLNQYPVKVINNGINLSVFSPTPSDLRMKLNCESKFVILGVAAVWNHTKGLDVFCQLAERLDSKYQIILVGTTDEVDKSLPSNIISVHRTQNQKELAMYYTMADVFLNPTRQDNYPTVNLEARACGTPVITFHTGGSPESAGMDERWIVYSNSLDETVEKIHCISTMKKEPYQNEKTAMFDEGVAYENYLDLYY